MDVRGKVVDSKGEPVSGATISVQGTNKTTLTNADGSFTLTGIEEDAVIVISHIQYETENITLNGRSLVNATLQIKISGLDELQVIAYGTTTKRLNTGNVSTVKSSDIAKQPVNNPLLALQGRVPGLIVTQLSGLPGGPVSVQIRGQNSIANGNLPLYIVDGIPYTPQLLTDAPNIIGNGNPFNYINAFDIESIEVLKDADATAIYGSRAANGAILITTKKGKAGKSVVDVNVQTGWGKVSRFMDLMNTQQYLEMRREALKNDNITPTTSNSPDLLYWDTTRYTDWQKELIGGTANWQDVQASLSGGNNNTQFFIGGSYHKETTVFPGDFADKKASLHFNISNTSLNRKFKVLLTGNFVSDNNRLPGSQDLTGIAMTLAPNAPPLYKADGSLNWAPLTNGAAGTWTNPLSYVHRPYKNLTNNLIMNSVISYQILPGLEIKNSAGYTNLHTDGFHGVPFLYFDPVRWPIRGNDLRSAQYSNNTIRSWIIEPQLNYSKTLGQGTLSLLIGLTIQQNNTSGSVVSGQGYTSDMVLEDIKSASAVTISSSTNSTYKYNALFGRLNYNWKEKYIVNLTARRDGSSRFGPENRFHNFGSAAVGWIFSKEKFLSNTSSVLSFGKLRLSYGTTGNDQVGDYSFLNLYNPTNVGIPYLSTNGLLVQGLYNPALQWEETKKAEVGLELGFIKDRILLSSSYFRNRSSNQLVSYGLPSTTGASSISKNLPATVQNSGFEITLNTVNLKRKAFSWNTNINLTIYRNKLVSYPDFENSTYANRYLIGRSLNIIKLYRFAGVNPTTGLYEFYDSKDNIVSIPDSKNDATIILDRNPKYYGGIQNSISYKAFELDFLFQYVKQTGISYEPGYLPGWLNQNQPVTVLNRWQKPGDNTTIQKFSSGFSIFFPWALYSGGDAAYTDASYFRLKNLSLSWQMPKTWSNRLKLDVCRFYIRAQNLLTITNYEGGLDPETMNVSTLPPLRTITFGINIKL
ncbi:hypothetical protein A4R26_32670 [Niastella populi]|uniref:SusC/RagA family TonB-linked outer membrane protein n=1 Tax=Niastella populi TaxID=550983 RepID=A0A1V9GAY9_9BACT|nr:hypothetical protein A4R26_32670 [Niastella populi]